MQSQSQPIGCGTVFSMTTGGAENVLYNFGSGGKKDGINPAAPLIFVGNTFYGTTVNGGKFGSGTVFSLTPGGVETVLHSFGKGTDGKNPNGLTLVGNILYGSTTGGGQSGDGTVFSITTDGSEHVLHSFAGADGTNPSGELLQLGQKLYGVASYGGEGGCGTVFSITTQGKEKTSYIFPSTGADGCEPTSGLMNVGGTLYGTTWTGGASFEGTVFSIIGA